MEPTAASHAKPTKIVAGIDFSSASGSVLRRAFEIANRTPGAEVHAIDQDAIHYYRHVRALEDVVGWSHQAITGPDNAYALQVTKGILTKGLAALAVP